MIDLSGRSSRFLKPVVNGADADRRIEEIAKQLDNIAIGAVANQHKSQDQLVQPVFGHGQMKQNIVIALGRRK